MARHNRALFFCSFQIAMKSEASARNSSISRCSSHFVSLISSKIVSILFSVSLLANLRASSRGKEANAIVVCFGCFFNCVCGSFP